MLSALSEPLAGMIICDFISGNSLGQPTEDLDPSLLKSEGLKTIRSRQTRS